MHVNPAHLTSVASPPALDRYALWLLWQSTDLASRRSVARACCAEDIINVMVSRSLSVVAQEHAAAVLASLTSEVQGVDDAVRSENQAAVVRSGGVQPLVRLLSTGNAGAKRHAALALAQLAEGTEVRGAVSGTQLEIAAEGAITRFVSWLHDPTQGPPAVAARALACIGRANSDTQLTIAEEGAIEPLVKMLVGDDGLGGAEAAPLMPPPKAVSENWNKAKQTVHTSRADGAGGRLAAAALGSSQVRLEDAVARRWAAGAIATLAEKSVHNQIRVAEEEGLAPLVELLKRDAFSLPTETHKVSTAPTSWDAPTRALWHLASYPDNQLGIAKAGGLAALVRVLSDGNEQARQWAAAALEALSRECPENQLALARSDKGSNAIELLVTLLGSDEEETQQHAQGALLHIAAGGDTNRNAVVKPLVGLLEVRNASATLMAARTLALLSARSAANCGAIAAEGAISPLAALLGDGRNASELQIRVAECLFHLSHAAVNKEAIIDKGGVNPLVKMLTSSNLDAQLFSCACLSHLAATTSGQQIIASANGVPLLVSLLSSERLDAAKHAAEALWHLEGAKAENKAAITKAGGIIPLVALLKREESAEAQELAASVLADLAKDKGPAKKAIVNVGALGPLVQLVSNGSAAAKKHSCCALWGLTLGDTAEAARHRSLAVGLDVVAPLVELLKDDCCEAHSFAVATLSNLAHDELARTHMAEANAVEPLIAIVRGPPSWLREHVTSILTHLGVSVADLVGTLSQAGAAAEAADKHRKGKRTRRESREVKGSGTVRKPPQSSSGSSTIRGSSRETGGGATKRAPSAKPDKPPAPATSKSKLPSPKTQKLPSPKQAPSPRAKLDGPKEAKEVKAPKGSKTKRAVQFGAAAANAPAAMVVG